MDNSESDKFLLKNKKNFDFSPRLRLHETSAVGKVLCFSLLSSRNEQEKMEKAQSLTSVIKIGDEK